MLGQRTLFAVRKMPHRPEHGAITAKAADKIGNWLCQKHTHNAETANLWQNYRQRHHNDDLAKQRKERRLFGLAKTNEGALPHRLKSHEEEAKEKEMHGWCAFGEQLRIRIEHMHDGLWQ